jgi:hypothetical protein
MIEYQEIQGNLITLALQGKFDVIVHGANCHSVMGAGLAPQMAKVFGCDGFVMELWGSTIEKLGNIDYETFVLGEHAIWNLDDAKNNQNDENGLSPSKGTSNKSRIGAKNLSKKKSSTNQLLNNNSNSINNKYNMNSKVFLTFQDKDL